jgi:hypothetical protein
MRATKTKPTKAKYVPTRAPTREIEVIVGYTPLQSERVIDSSSKAMVRPKPTPIRIEAQSALWRFPIDIGEVNPSFL